MKYLHRIIIIFLQQQTQPRYPDSINEEGISTYERFNPNNL